MERILRKAGPFQTVGFVLFLSVVLLPFPETLAQIPPPAQPGQLERQLEPERRPGRPAEAPRAPAEIERPARPAAPGGPPQEEAASRALVKKFRITGNSVIATKELEALVRSEEGKRLNLAEMNAVRDRIKDYYDSKGYFLAYAYLPQQDISEGVVEIAILEGQVGEVKVTGTQRYDPDLIARALTRVKNRGVVHEGLLETAITDLNEYPGLAVRSSLEPGARPGFTDIVMTVNERLPVSLVLDVDNFGSRYTGPWRYGVELGLGNLTGFGDKVTIRGIKSDDDLNFGRLSYLVPLGGYGTKVGLSYVHAENGVGEELANLQITGRLDILSLDLTQPLLRTSRASFQFTGGFDYKRLRTFVVTSATPTDDDIRTFRLGFSGDYADPFHGRTLYGATWYQGSTLFGGSKKNDLNASRAGGPGNFSKWTVDLARLQSLDWLESLIYSGRYGSYLVLRGFGQMASQNLLQAERYSIGGYNTVRGYPISEFSGDHGYAVTAEVVIPVPYIKEWVQAVGFIDHGGVFIVSPTRNPAERKFHFLTGSGGGLRINVPVPGFWGFPGGSLQTRVDYGLSLGDPSPTSRKNGITEGKPGVVYFSSSFRF